MKEKNNYIFLCKKNLLAEMLESPVEVTFQSDVSAELKTLNHLVPEFAVMNKEIILSFFIFIWKK